MPHLWSRLIDAPFARVNHQCVFLNNSLYIFGGHNRSFNSLDLDLYELDVFSYDLDDKKWSRVIFCRSSYQWDGKNGKLIYQNTKNNVPSLRFGHSVVTWRGRAWLFGGRSHVSECSNDIFMFCPSESWSCEKKYTFPIWAKGVNVTGDIPMGSDSHAAAVLHDFVYKCESYTNSLHCLDFLAWNWTKIKFTSSASSFYPPEIIPSDVESIFREMDQIWQRESDCDSLSNNNPITTNVPLPREYATLIVHDGRLFLFGGRSSHPYRSRDIYDSILWELLPVNIIPNNTDQKVLDCNEMECDEFLNSINFEFNNLQMMCWEENTGNWKHPLPWYSAPRRFKCLNYHLKKFQKLKCSKTDESEIHHNNQNPWKNGFGFWKKLNIGHGIKTDDCLIDLMGLHLSSSDSKRSFDLIEIFNLNHGNNDFLSNRSNKLDRSELVRYPLGRRSLSSWSYDGNIYIAFGLLMCASTSTDSSLHFNDLWKFNIKINEWICLRSNCPNEGFQNATYPLLNSLTDYQSCSGWNIPKTLPLPRRRATACLGLQSPNDRRNREPIVYVFGGAHPRNYGSVLKVKVTNRAPANPPQLTYNGSYENQVTFNIIPVDVVSFISMNDISKKSSAPIVWIIKRDQTINLVIIIPGSRVDSIPSNWGVHTTTMEKASLFISRKEFEYNSDSELVGSLTINKDFNSSYFDSSEFIFFKNSCRVAQEAVLAAGNRSNLLPEDVHALFNIIVITGFESHSEEFASCIRRQYYQLEPSSTPNLMPAVFHNCPRIFQDNICDLIPRIMFTLRHHVILNINGTSSDLIFIHNRDLPIPNLNIYAYFDNKSDWTESFLPLLKPFIPIVLKSALSLEWTVPYVAIDAPILTQESEVYDSEEVFIESDELTHSSRSNSPQYNNSYPGVRILQNFFSLSHSPVTSFNPNSQSDQDALILPDFGVITVDTYSSLSNSCDFYKLNLDCSLKNLCIRQLKVQMLNDDHLVRFVEHNLSEKLKLSLMDLHPEQIDWRWTQRSSADG